MKKLLLTTASFMVVALSAWSQGSVFFSNEPLSTGGDVNAPVSAEDGTTRLTGAGFQAQLMARAGGTSGAFQPVGNGVGFLPAGASPSGNGYWIPTTFNIPFLPNNSQAEVYARAWRVADGTTFDAARAANRGWGQSNPVTVSLGGGVALPAEMVGMNAFSLVPEPSTIALGILGGLGTLVLVRRRK